MEIAEQRESAAIVGSAVSYCFAFSHAAFHNHSGGEGIDWPALARESGPAESRKCLKKLRLLAMKVMAFEEFTQWKIF
jgi:hypothetical protein